jgi:carboxypeptidase C (cathepsin A)
VLTSDATATPPAPFGLVDNEYSLLDKSDLVFIDAVGTGFSRIIGKGTPKEFYGVDADARAFAQFIQRYVTINNRWNSPKFLFGESYGTTRSAVLVNYLQQHGMGFNGVVMLSSYLNAGLEESGDGNDYMYIVYLPTEAAIAWYHNKLPHRAADLTSFVQSARQFALGDYASALMRGAALSDSERNNVVWRLHQFIGLPVSTIRDADMRVDPSQFEKLLLHDRYRVVGRLDARFIGVDTNPSDPTSPLFDPSEAAISSAFVGAFNYYVRDDLKFETQLGYKDFGDDIGEWDLKHAANGVPQDILDVLPDLRQAMSENPHLRVFSANGYFDMATPFFETQYGISHMGLDRSLEKNVNYGFYQSGHMAYLHVPVLKQMHEDLVRFYDSTKNY